ncbi:MAG: hypothetical protein EAZ95_18025 [Bacteroidetes bacterium]|nr:MAG: hypothetical protein EAZ95_18025 [Bacteroidota bacterium]
MNSYDSNLPAQVRKENGVFYSPEMIAQYVVNEALKAFLVGKADQVNALQNIHILDIACGAGVFLEVSLEVLLGYYALVLPTFEDGHLYQR